jgi:hypothetical protein
MNIFYFIKKSFFRLSIFLFFLCFNTFINGDQIDSSFTEQDINVLNKLKSAYFSSGMNDTSNAFYSGRATTEEFRNFINDNGFGPFLNKITTMQSGSYEALYRSYKSIFDGIGKISTLKNKQTDENEQKINEKKEKEEVASWFNQYNILIYFGIDRQDEEKEVDVESYERLDKFRKKYLPNFKISSFFEGITEKESVYFKSIFINKLEEILLELAKNFAKSINYAKNENFNNNSKENKNSYIRKSFNFKDLFTLKNTAITSGILITMFMGYKFYKYLKNKKLKEKKTLRSKVLSQKKLLKIK